MSSSPRPAAPPAAPAPAALPRARRPRRGGARLAVTRWALRSLDRLAPAAAEKLMWRLFSTPQRPQPARTPQSASLPARKLNVESPAGRPLATWSWGSGPTVLLVHGWSGHAAQMADLVAPLVQAGFQVVAFDQPAHGQSAGRRTNMLEFREAVLAMGASLGPLHAVVGHSLGGTASLLALDRGLVAGRLVLLAPPLDPPLFVRAFAGHMGLPAHRAAALGEQITAWVQKDIGARDARTVAAGLSHPGLIIQDDGDRAVDPADARALAAAWPGARLITLTGFGHNRMLSAPEVIAPVTEFLKAGLSDSRRVVTPGGGAPLPARSPA